MTKRISLAALAVLAAGLSGCATTSDDPQSTSAASPSSSSSSQASSTGTGTRSGVKPGTPVAPGSAAVAKGDRPDLKRSVYYEFDKYDVKPEYRALVESHARWLRANPQARLTIEGNADEQGSREYNLALGQKRAESVGKIMVLMGVRAEQIEAISYGEERPRASGHDEKAWSENRRSDFAPR